MRVNSLPIRDEDSLLAEMAIWNAGDKKQKFNLFVEDQNGDLAYSELLDRKYTGMFEVNIYRCLSRSAVIEKFLKWKSNSLDVENILFLVDKDFTIWSKDDDPVDKHFLRWGNFTFENYLIDKTPTIYALRSLLLSKSHHDIEPVFSDWSMWIENMYLELKDLFICFVISHKYELGKNTSLSPHKFYDSKKGKLCTQRINQEIENIKIRCTKKGFDFDTSFDDIEKYYLNRPLKGMHELVKGKYYYTYLIYEINNRAKMIDTSIRPWTEKSAFFHFLVKTPIENFYELWDKIDGIAIV
ncbi:hypothetical protein [Listeria newyorkensis]|uniref:hypothetical protein n=1 Tax=Listeria newyorkensis TaxID=1497681 RepID=UPI00051DF2E6|nr:hypothetical protein [Listeria newyorkensis]KGL43578.1 hypothetical protein EP58_07510 [Listeria newyorkensis]